MRLLITGGMGFIGSNFILHMLEKHPSYRIINLDSLTYAGNTENLEQVRHAANVQFIHGSITDRPTVDHVMQEVEAVIHFAAESHVDRSISSPYQFVDTNVAGTHYLLEAARRQGITKFIHISTDEVYGSLGPTGYFTEQSPIAPNSPYSASKAASDLLARSYYETYRFPVVISRCSNNYGPRQFPEKLIPLIITRALEDQPIPIYGDGLNIRDWLFVEDHCRAIDLLLHQGVPGEVYNIGGNNEHSNLDIARAVLQQLGKPESLLQFVSDRPGHDRRYAIDAAKINKQLGWSPVNPFHQGLQKTLDWYTGNISWWKKILERERMNSEA
ncbi:dTDP-glucose 4,6-dehydratase [Paenibacillus mendelii]|uniref:dTDP-glucose 4,6-dehydratase n=1 Tax=Paenibacillus mendelii TaxID=206163 RepID=A0ABV6J926_9BACL|nr:dTDP-glucose 4,6-dehydratase [Paenibacillus mendelii]MCQ6559724.1 dTDP-glucose 4,6-dehydratase [Paenibacillus mendelii]